MRYRLQVMVLAIMIAVGAGGGYVAAAHAQVPGVNGSIAFERFDPAIGDSDIYRIGPEGGEPQLLWVGGDGPHWSPDGRQLAFTTCLDPPTCDTAVALLDPATGVVHGFSMPDPGIFTPCVVWNPDGSRLACEGQGQLDAGLNGIYTIRSSDGGDLTRVTSNPGGDDNPLEYSPDGTRLLFNRFDPTRPARANQALFVATAEGHNAHRITPWGFSDDQASWSPDGQLIAFGTRGSLYVVHPDGSDLAKVPLEPGSRSQSVNAFDVSWAPDGTRLLFSLRPAGSQHPSLYTATPDGRHLQVLTASPTGDHHSNWQRRPTP